MDVSENLQKQGDPGKTKLACNPNEKENPHRIRFRQ
jgi:hypothetical protein